MRYAICLVFAALVVGCGRPEIECGRNTCSGCCTAAGECVLGAALTACGGSGGTCIDCSAQGLVCNSGGVCGKPADGGQDAGQDAGTADAGVSQVFVTFRYDILVPLGGSCPDYQRKVESCGITKSMTKAKLDVVRMEYGACPVTQDSADGWTIDCRGNCFTQQETCSTSAGGSANFTETYCPPPKYATGGACLWEP